MALRPVDNESFYREVDEELRRDQMKTYWERFGKLVIAGVLLVLAAIGGFIWWQNQKEVKAGEQAPTLVEAFDDVAAGRKAAASAKLDGLVKSGSRRASRRGPAHQGGPRDRGERPQGRGRALQAGRRRFGASPSPIATSPW